jgi:hypothetical protein
MELLRIRRFQARYRLPRARQAERERLDGLLREVLDEGLDRALERAGVSPHEVVCIRRLHVPVRLRLSAGNHSLAMAWSLALADSIVRARDAQVSTSVVRYSSPIHALIDLALGLARESFDRVWAWRSAGIWHGSDAPARSEAAFELVRALAQEPSAIVPVLVAVADSKLPARTFARFAEAFSDRQWIALAGAALQAAGVEPAVLDEAGSPGIAEVVVRAHRILAESPLARGIAGVFFRRTGGSSLASVEIRRALAALLVLSHDPGSMRPARPARALLNALADAMHPAALRVEAPPPETPPHPPSSAPPRTPPSEQPQARPSTPPAARPHQPSAEEEAPVEVRRLARTRFGGLLFLLGLIEQLGIPEEIAVRLERRSFRWMLHRLALALVPAEPDDPAALAFAGLPPDARPPSFQEEPPTEPERETISSFAARIDAALEELLERKHSVPFVCEREAEIAADPGWIEVRLPLSEVSTAIRRVGLDLDPGYVPWLGVVVRFVYA